MKCLVRLMLCWMISFTLIEFPMMKSAHAGMISTSTAVEQMTKTADHQKVADFMGRKEVQDQLIKLGVNPIEAQERVAGLSDNELRKIAGSIENNTAGGNIVGILTLVLLVILIIYFAKRI